VETALINGNERRSRLLRLASRSAVCKALLALQLPQTAEDPMKLPDWNAAEWVLVLTLAGFACILVSMLAGLGLYSDKLP
jgi:hypothetical protein